MQAIRHAMLLVSVVLAALVSSQLIPFLPVIKFAPCAVLCANPPN